MKASVGKGKRVLMLLENHAYPGDARVRREAVSLVAVGYSVTVICPQKKGQPWQEMINGIKVYRYPAPRDGDGLIGYILEYGYSLAAAWLLSIVVFFREGFDIIHSHNPPDMFFLIAALYKPFGRQFVFDHHDLSPEMYDARFDDGGNKWVRRALLWLESGTFRLADHVIATNESYKQIALTRGKKAEHEVTVVRNGPDLNRVQIVPPDAALRAKAKTIIGYVGVMGFQDGVDYFLRALHHLSHDLGRSDFYAVIIGTGDAWESLKQTTSELKLDDHVWFTGRVSDEDLLRYLNSTDICVDPDPWNPFNDRSTMIKMTEYMALAKPIVAFGLTEHKVTAQDAALYAARNDELDFARKLVQLMDDEALREKMGCAGKKRMETQLAWKHQAPKLQKAYEMLRMPASSQPLSSHAS